MTGSSSSDRLHHVAGEDLVEVEAGGVRRQDRGEQVAIVDRGRDVADVVASEPSDRSDQPEMILRGTVAAAAAPMSSMAAPAP